MKRCTAAPEPAACAVRIGAKSTATHLLRLFAGKFLPLFVVCCFFLNNFTVVASGGMGMQKNGRLKLLHLGRRGTIEGVGTRTHLNPRGIAQGSLAVHVTPTVLTAL